MTRTAQSLADGRKQARRRWRHAGPLVVVLVAVAALAAACSSADSSAASSSGGSTNSQDSSSAPSSSSRSGLLFISCVRTHGVASFPDSAVSANDGQLELNVPGYLKAEPQFQSALTVCQKDLPGGGSAAKTQHVSIQQELVYASCMRSHGVTNFPDPLPGGGFNFTGNTSSPQFQAADTACRSALGSAGSNGS
jgi:hypothetical protein